MFAILSKGVVQNILLATSNPSVIFTLHAAWICELMAMLHPVSIFK